MIIKETIYKACVQSALTYETEAWAMKKANLQSLERTERMMVRSVAIGQETQCGFV